MKVPRGECKDSASDGKLTPEEVRRLADSARARGELTTEITRRYVLQTVDTLIDWLDGGKRAD